MFLAINKKLKQTKKSFTSTSKHLVFRSKLSDLKLCYNKELHEKKFIKMFVNFLKNSDNN